jgi:hypothetical protein
MHGAGSVAEFCWQIVSWCARTVTLMEDGRQQIGEFLWLGDLIGAAYPRRKVEELAPTHVAAADLRRAHQQIMLLAIRTAQLCDRVAMIELRENCRGVLKPCQC